MKYWLLKSEPDVFSIDDLYNCKDRTEPWDGIRNYQARNFMRDEMKIDDQCFFYHSNCKLPGIVGIMTVVSNAYPDKTQFDKKSKYFDPKSKPGKPTWINVDVKFKKKLNLVSLETMKNHSSLKDLLILRKGNRLSITPIIKLHWDYIIKLSK